MSILLRDCSWVVTQNASRDVLRDKSIYVEDGTIGEIASKIAHEADRVIECKDKIVMPGLINTHTHLPMTLLRGYVDDMPLQEWLEKKIWPTERKLTGELSYQGALLGCLEMIRTGTTCFMDMYFFMEDVASAVKKSGLRAFLSHAIIDLFDPERAEKDRENTQRLHRFVQNLGEPRIRFVLGPHAPYTCKEETLLRCKEISEKEKILIHTHIAETKKEQASFETKHGRREVEYLDKIGFLSPRLVAVHGVWLTRNEIELFRNQGVKVSHCPVSNMKLGDGGVAPLPEMFERGVTVSLGTDSASSNNCLDMFETMKICSLLHKAQRWDPTILPAQKVLDLATLGGAETLQIAEKVGSIEEGKAADIIALDLNAPNMMPIHGGDTVVSDLIYSAKGMNVSVTIVDGRLLMAEGKFQTIDEHEVYRAAQKAAMSLIR